MVKYLYKLEGIINEFVSFMYWDYNKFKHIVIIKRKISFIRGIPNGSYICKRSVALSNEIVSSDSNGLT